MTSLSFYPHFSETKPSLRATATALLLATVFLLFYYLPAAPKEFPKETIFEINRGNTLFEVSQNLKEENYIKFPSLFRLWMSVRYGQNSVKAGKYIFDSPANMFAVARRMAEGDFGVTPISVVIPEGWTARKIASVLEEADVARADDFLDLAVMENFPEFAELFDGAPTGATLEGYLFPDTYFFMRESAPEQVVAAMLKNLRAKITPDMLSDIESRGLNVFDVITMASIIEKEAARVEDRRVISGILWNRLGIGMPLQVDATLTYVLEKSTLELNLDDLKEDFPYNTYKYRGLPAGPIANPGLDSIIAAIYPNESDYLYYLSDRAGNTYFSETFEGHKINKAKYLK